MTELQIGLIGFGIALVVGILVHDKWQERRYRKLAEKMLNPPEVDVLLDQKGVQRKESGLADEESDEESLDDPFPHSLEESLEESHAEVVEDQDVAPSERDDFSWSPASPVDSAERIEPVLRAGSVLDEEAEPRRDTGDLAEMASAAQQQMDQSTPVVHVSSEPKGSKAMAEPIHLLSPIIDYIASFEAVKPATVAQILYPTWEVIVRLRKPVLWAGFNENTREWEAFDEHSAGSFKRIRAGLQLVDRHGILMESDLDAFYLTMQNLAANLMAIVDFPPKHAALDAAIKLDELCARVDIQIGLNVISSGKAFHGTQLRALMESAGLLIDPEGRYVRYDELGNVLFVVLNHGVSGFSMGSMKNMTTHGATFLLDVPRVANGARAFGQMLELARRVAEVLKGILVDDNRQPLYDQELEPIRQQIIRYQSIMQEQGLPPGNPFTQRLFS